MPRPAKLFSARRRASPAHAPRAWSIKIRRISCAATPKKCARLCQFTDRCSTSFKIRFVNQRRRLQSVVDSFAAHVTARQPPQLVVHHRDKLRAAPLSPRVSADNNRVTSGSRP